jgi:hypothetical protein
MQTDTAALENSLAVPQKFKYNPAMWIYVYTQGN